MGECELTELILTLHLYNVYLVLTSTIVAGVWGLVLFFRHKDMSAMPKSWRIMLIVAGLLGVLQALFGITMVLLGLKPGGGHGYYYLHYVYGGIVALGLPVAMTYATSGKQPRRDVLIYSIALLIMAAAAIRAFMTGPG
jgi:heme A synthase